MKKFILITPIFLIISMFSFNGHLEAAGCSSHKSKKAQVECPLTDDNCDSNKSNKVES